MDGTEFISKDELIELVKKSNTPNFDKDFLSLVSNKSLKKYVQLAINGEVSKKMAKSLFESACLDIVKRIVDFNSLYTIGLSFYSKELKEAYIHTITGNKHLQLRFSKRMKGIDFERKKKELKTLLADIAALSENRSFLRDCVINPKNYGIDGYEAEVLYNHNSVYGDDFSVSNREIWKYIDDDYFAIDYKKPSEEDKNNLGPLDYTDAEIFSVKMYAGQTPGIGPLASSTISFRTLNIMFFPGIDSELERIYDDIKELIPGALYQADELMDRALDLFSIMYKYGKRMNSDAKGYRVDRASTADLIYKENRTVSYFSSSKTGYKLFPKKDIALIEATIKKGTPCVDFNDVLGTDYKFSKEAEILVAPNCKVTSSRPRKPTFVHEKEVKNILDGRASAVYNMEIMSPEAPRSLSAEELADLERKERIFYDERRRDKAAKFITKVQNLKEIRQRKDEAIEIIDVADINSYLEWKKAFQDVYGYRVRQIMFQIDKAVIEALKENKTLFTEQVASNPSISIQGSGMSKLEPEKKENVIPENEIIDFINGYISGNNKSNLKNVPKIIDEIVHNDKDGERRDNRNY